MGNKGKGITKPKWTMTTVISWPKTAKQRNQNRVCKLVVVELMSMATGICY
jgi:hypothetical protein